MNQTITIYFWRIYSSKIVINVIIYTFYICFLFLDVFLNKYVFVTLARVRCSFVWNSCQTDRQSDRDRRTGVRGACHNIDTCLVETLMLSEGHQRNVGFCWTFYIRQNSTLASPIRYIKSWLRLIKNKICIL